MTGLTGVLKAADPVASGLAQWLRNNRMGEIHTGDVYYGRYWALWKFTLGDVVAPVSPSEAAFPVSKAFQDGKWVFRTGWDNPNDSYVTVRANRWMRNGNGMSPNAPGGFTIDRKGPQVTFQGGNDGHEWGSESGAGPANVLLFVDTSRTGPSGPYDDLGGHRLAPDGTRGSLDWVPGSPYDAREAARFLPASASASRDADYVMVDVTRSYSSTRYRDNYNPARVSEVVRQVVYFRPTNIGVDPDRVVVFDRATTTDTKFEKRWLFHTSAEPLVNGSVTPGIPVRNGSGAGKWTYAGATRVTATNTVNGSNGRVFLTPLLPASRTIVKVGGPNAAGVSWQTDSHEYEDPLGFLNKGNVILEPDKGQYVGQYRVEIIPSTPALTDVFLNVVEVGNASVTAPLPTTVLPSTGLVAARVGDRIAVFNRVSSAVTTGDLTVDISGDYGINIADLYPNRDYEVTISGSVTTKTASAAGTLYLRESLAAGARISLRAIGGTVASTPPAAPTNLRVVR
jgi:hypothetical protein